jgi:glycine/D-amino acid oxidase-like deaminating enzyme
MGKRIVICGGGAIGAAIAYFTSRRGAWPITIERHEVAGAASGKSGGFLALDRVGAASTATTGYPNLILGVKLADGIEINSHAQAAAA